MVATADAEWDGTGRDGVTRSKKGQMVRVMKRLHRASEREREREENTRNFDFGSRFDFSLPERRKILLPSEPARGRGVQPLS